MIQCPVCNKNGLSEALQSCPQCNADLECFQLLDKLIEPDTENALQQKQIDKVFVNKENNKNNGSRLYMVVLIVICMLLIGQIFYFKRQFIQSEQALKSEISQLSKQLQKTIKIQSSKAKPVIVKRSDNTALQAINNKITAMKEIFSAELFDIKNNISLLSSTEENARQQLDKPSDDAEVLSKQLPKELFVTQQEEHIILYQSTKDDTLWSIAKKFYGSGIYYPVILKMNPGLSLKNHQRYGKIKLFKQHKNMLESYKKINSHQPLKSQSQQQTKV